MAPLPLLAALILVSPALAGWGPGAVPAPAPVGLSPAAALAAHDLLHAREVLGRSPAGWLAWGEGLAQPRAAHPSAASLPEEVRGLYHALGLAPGDAALARLDRDAAALDPAFGALVAGLVRTVADAAAAQVEVAARLRWDDPAMQVLAPEDAAATLARAGALRDAAGAAAVLARAIPPARLAAFADPLGLVVVGGTGPDVFAPDPSSALGQPLLLLDLGGDDLDLTSAGGACAAKAAGSLVASCNGLPVALRVDLGGNDTYLLASPAGRPPVAQGSGAFGGLGVLVDFGGDDLYRVEQDITSITGLTSYITGVAQGSGEAGVGLLLDLDGHDRYEVLTRATKTSWTQAQGFAGAGGIGALVDADGSDAYEADVLCDDLPKGIWCGIYVQGTAIYPGVGLILDLQGHDLYRGFVRAPQEDYYSQGFGAFGGLGIQADYAGDDTYEDRAVSYLGHFAVSLNCAFGTAFYGGLAVFLDADGDDSYYSETVSDNPPFTMAEGFSYIGSASLFWDVRGDDHHEMVALGAGGMIAGRGLGSALLDNVLAVYLDTGGSDAYPDGIGSENAVWTSGASAPVGVGADLALVP